MASHELKEVRAGLHDLILEKIAREMVDRFTYSSFWV